MLVTCTTHITCSSSSSSGYGTPPSPPFPFDVGPEALEELWQGKQIDRIPLNKLTKAYFLHRYVEGQRPLAIEGALLDSPMYTNWNWTRLAKVCNVSFCLGCVNR